MTIPCYLATLLGNGEIPLHEGLKDDVEVKGTCLNVAEELLNGNPSLASNATTLTDNVLQLDGDGPENPGEDNAIHPTSGGDSEGHHVCENVVVDSIALQGEEDKVAPTDIAGGSQVKENGNQGLDVLDTHRLGMKVGNDGCLICQQGLTIWYSKSGSVMMGPLRWRSASVRCRASASTTTCICS